MLAATSGAAFAAVAFHYIDKGPDEYGCRSTTGSRNDLNMSCTREIGVCRALTDLKRISTQEWKQKWDNPWAVQLACSEMVSEASFQLFLRFFVSFGLNYSFGLTGNIASCEMDAVHHRPDLLSCYWRLRHPGLG